MQVHEAMTELVLSVGPDHSLRRAAELMSERRVGAAVVVDPEADGPGIITERDVLNALAAGLELDSERVSDHLGAKLVFAAPDWSLKQAAARMISGGFRHLVVIDEGEVSGVLSMRDIVRCWSESDWPASVAG